MSAHAVWIDERKKDRAARLKRAQRRWQLEDKLRGYPVYRQGEKYKSNPARHGVIDGLMLGGAIVLVALLLRLH